jgi:hypothetical protein
MNALAVGLRLGVAPRFHSPVAWDERLRVNSGTQRLGGLVLPRPDWRAPTLAGLQLLLAGDDAATAKGFLTEGLTLLGIPEHLRRAWWEAAAPEITEGNAAGPGSQAFTRALAAFLGFKGWPFPPAAACELILSDTGRPSTRLDPATGAPAGLGLLLDAPDWGVLNLGDEVAALHFVNLSPARCLELQGPTVHAAEASAAWFFERWPDYPLVRHQLWPGEGVRLPEGGLFWDGGTVGKSDVDVLLVVRGG